MAVDNVSDEFPQNLKFYSDDAYTNEITDITTVGLEGSMELGESGTIEDTKTVTIYWKWDYQTGTDANTIADNDEIDTAEGEQARSITFDVIVTGTQQENV